MIAQPFNMFSSTHVLALLSMLLLVLLTLLFARTAVCKRHTSKLNRLLAVVLLLCEVYIPFFEVNYHNLPLLETLPLHMCDFSRIFLAAYLLFGLRALFELAYFWGIAGGLIAVLTPDVAYGFPAPEFLFFYCTHGLLFVSVAYCACLAHYTPSWWHLLRAMIYGVAVSLLILCVNMFIGENANYWYLMIIPASTGGIYDFIPESPWHLVVYYAIAAILFTSVYCANQTVRFLRARIKKSDPR